MTIKLRQSTAAQAVPLGHFLDETDGRTAETALSIANTDIKLWKSGASSLVDKNAGGATHMAGGVYVTTLDATDTDTAGPLVFFIQVAGALPLRLECEVLTQEVYDTMVAGTRVLGTPTENADALLKRDWTAVTGEASRSVLNALRWVRNGFTINPTTGVISILKEDDTTVAYTRHADTDATAEPITGVGA